MKIVIYKPYHDIWFKSPVGRILKKQIIPSKYEPLFNYLASSKGRLYVSTRLVFRKGLGGWVDLCKDISRLLVWVALNKIDLRRVGFVLTLRHLEKMDAIFFMHYGCFTHEQTEAARSGRELALKFSRIRVRKIVHMTHYAYHPIVGAENLRILRPDLMVAENDLKKNSQFFNRYFQDISGGFYHLPYVAGKRFQKRVAFADRINKLGVTGSITYKMRDPEFLEFFGQNELQPMRRKIYEQRDSLSDRIASFIYDLDESRRTESQSGSGGGTTAPRTQAQSMATQRNYYNADIVEFFNRYTMFAVPEEVCDLPGIGFVEGMACGSAYVGIDDPMYRDLGMIPGTHYVAYDGTIEGLLEKISYYQEHREELERIAEQGYQFARTQLSGESVYSAFLERLGKTLSRV